MSLLRGGTTKQPRRLHIERNDTPKGYQTKKALQMQDSYILNQNVGLRHLQFLLYISYVAFEFLIGIN